jgi:hypothetical protein
VKRNRIVHGLDPRPSVGLIVIFPLAIPAHEALDRVCIRATALFDSLTYT